MGKTTEIFKRQGVLSRRRKLYSSLSKNEISAYINDTFLKAKPYKEPTPVNFPKHVWDKLFYNLPKEEIDLVAEASPDFARAVENSKREKHRNLLFKFIETPASIQPEQLLFLFGYFRNIIGDEFEHLTSLIDRIFADYIREQEYSFLADPFLRILFVLTTSLKDLQNAYTAAANLLFNEDLGEYPSLTIRDFLPSYYYTLDFLQNWNGNTAELAPILKNYPNAAYVNLRGINLREADLPGICLKNKNLTEAVLIGAKLKGANLSWTNLQYANLYNADLRNVNLYRANLQYANLRWTKLQYARLVCAYLQNADLTEANLQNAHLELADLQNANLERANLTKANLYRAKLQCAYLKLASLQNANLEWTNLQNANLEEADLQNANLERANLTKAILVWADLENADLTEAILYKADLEGANLDDTKLLLPQLEAAKFAYIRLGGRSIPRELALILVASEAMLQSEEKEWGLQLGNRFAFAHARLTPRLIEASLDDGYIVHQTKYPKFYEFEMIYPSY